MLVFWDHRLVFLATPKTGSTAIEAALEPLSALSVLRPPVLKHTTFHRYSRFLSPYLKASSGNDFQTVALMREPKAWLGSWFRYRSRPGTAPEKSTAGMSFDDFIAAYVQDNPPAFADVGSQERFLRPRQEEKVDFLFRYEDMTSFIRFLENRLGFEITLPRLNVSPEGDLALSASGEQLLQAGCAKDFALYESISAIGAEPSPSGR